MLRRILLSLLLYASVLSCVRCAPSTCRLVSFVAIHFEPRSGQADAFPELEKLVQVADAQHVKLTLELTPPWAKMLLSDSTRLARIRQWQGAGHEVAAHHHGVLHDWDWDGYCNRPRIECEQVRATIYANASPEARQVQLAVRDAGLGEVYLGTMGDYMALLALLADPATVSTMTMGPDREIDWPDNVPFSVDNIVPGPGGRYVISGGARTQPEQKAYSGHAVTELGMRFIYDQETLDLAKTELESATGNDVIGVVTHIEDFARDPRILSQWLTFIAANGARSKTVSEILTER
jgi:hypothetical protein